MNKLTSDRRPALTMSKLADEYFGANIRVSFVGGSYAKIPSATSDVDIFLILNQSDRAAEKAFAAKFLAFHEERGLKATHCGEVFTVETLEHLLLATEQVLEAIPDIQNVGCYHGDCFLSVFRKGDVVFRFLADPKIHIFGDTGYLLELEKQAKLFFERFPMPRVQLDKGRLDFRGDARLREQEEAVRNLCGHPDYADSPIGVGLERWFGPQAFDYTSWTRHLGGGSLTTVARHECPLGGVDIKIASKSVFGKQCLGIQKSH